MEAADFVFILRGPQKAKPATGTSRRRAPTARMTDLITRGSPSPVAVWRTQHRHSPLLSRIAHARAALQGVPASLATCLKDLDAAVDNKKRFKVGWRLRRHILIVGCVWPAHVAGPALM